MTKKTQELFECDTPRSLVDILEPRGSSQKKRWSLIVKMSEYGLAFSDIYTLFCSFPMQDIENGVLEAVKAQPYVDFTTRLVRFCENSEKKRIQQLYSE